MPIYEYECRACGQRTDALQKVSDKPLRKCPACGKLQLRRLVSAPAFHLKGTGWYVTDFRDKGKPGAKLDGDKANGSGDGDKGKSSTEAKPEKPAAKNEQASTSQAK